MSRRFGRQQKRKLRQEIQDQKRKSDHLQRQCNDLYRSRQRSQEIIDRVKNVLGENFIALDPQEVDLDCDSLPPNLHLPLLDMCDVNLVEFVEDHAETISSFSSLIQSLNLLSVSVERKEFQAMTHIYARCRNSNVGYYLSDKSLLGAEKEVVVGSISRIVAQKLVNVIRGI